MAEQTIGGAKDSRAGADLALSASGKTVIVSNNKLRLYPFISYPVASSLRRRLQSIGWNTKIL
jgi:hypothetical protein